MEPTSETQSEPIIPPQPSPGGWPSWLAPLVLALLILAAFFPTLAERKLLGPVGETILLNPDLNFRGMGAENIKWAFHLQETAEQTRQYHPLVWVSYGLDWLFYKDNARGYVLTNVLLHFFSALFLYLISVRLFTAAAVGRPETPSEGATAIRLGALLAALLFAVHPLRAESVAWVLERRDCLCGFFFLASVLTYLRYRDLVLPLSEEDPLKRKPGRPRLWLVISVLLALAATLSKATAVCLPLVLIILDFYPLRASAKRTKGLWWDRAPFFIVAGIGILTAFQALDVGVDARAANLLAVRADDLRTQIAAEIAGEGTPDPAQVTEAQMRARAMELAKQEMFPGPADIKAQAVMALHGSLSLLGKMVVPAGLLPVYETPADEAWNADKTALIGAVAAVVITIVLLALMRVWPAGLSAWLCYLVLLLPVSGIVRIGVPIEADRHSYLAGMACAVLVGSFLWVLCRRREPATGVRSLGVVGSIVAAGLVLVLTGLTFGQAQIWRNETRFWTRAVEIQPDNWRAHASLGQLLRHQEKLVDSEEAYRRAIELSPDSWGVYNNLGTVLIQNGKTEEALECFMKARDLNPNVAEVRANVWTYMFALQRLDDAKEEILDVLNRFPVENTSRTAMYLRARALNDLGAIHYLQGDYNDAIERFRECLAVMPIFSTAHQGLGDAWLAKGEKAQAIAHYEEALRIKPTDQGVRQKLSDLTGGEPGAGGQGQPPMDPAAAEEMRNRVKQEVERLRQAIEADPDDAKAHYEMGLLLSQIGQLEPSITHLQQAIAVDPQLAGAYHRLVAVFLRTGRAADAIAMARQGLEAVPKEAALMGLLAHALATSTDPGLADPAEAMEWARKAVETEPDNPSLREALAVALEANGQTDEAIQTLKEAKAMAEAAGNAPVAERLARRLAAFEGQRDGTDAAPEAPAADQGAQ